MPARSPDCRRTTAVAEGEDQDEPERALGVHDDVGEHGLAAQQAQDFTASYPHLIHAQDILTELRATLRVDACPGGPALGALYDWLHVQLVRANVQRDAQITAECLPVIESLVQTWHEAAGLAASA